MILWTFLHSESYLDGTSTYVFKCQPSLRSANYLGKPSLNEIYRIDEDDGLPGILAALEDPSRKLELTLLEPMANKTLITSSRFADDVRIGVC